MTGVAPLQALETSAPTSASGEYVFSMVPTPDLDELIQLVAQVFGVSMAAIAIVESERVWLKAWYGSLLPGYPKQGSFWDGDRLNGNAVVVKDVNKDERFRKEPITSGPLHARFYAAVPLVAPGGLSLGALTLMNDVPLPFDDRDIARLAAFSRQVIWRMETHKQLEGALDYQRFFSNPSGLFALADFAGYFKELSPGWRALLGFSLAELVQKPSIEFVHPNDREFTTAAMSQLSSGKMISVENRYMRRDGSCVWLHWTAFSSVTRRCIYATAVDITKQKTAEQHLQDSLTRMAAVVDTAVDGIATIDELGTLETINPAITRIFGYTPDDIIGQNVKVLMPEPYHSGHDQYLQRYLQTGERRIIGVGREVLGRRKNGDIFPIELSVSEMKLGDRRAFTGLVRDITERKEVDRLKGEFVSTVSHELRTPLTSIKGSLRLLSGGIAGKLSNEALDLVSVASSNADRLLRLINDILDLEKIAARSVENNWRRIEAAALVRDTVTEISGMAEQFGVRVSTQIHAEPRVLGDSDRLAQVLTNLISNAIKFSNKDDTVVVSLEANNGKVLFMVRDQGIGIRSSQIPLLFKKFQQLDASDSRERAGTGLGLAICKEIVERHNGQIGATSVFGSGSTFYFELAELTEEREEEVPYVLVVDDDPYASRMTYRFIERLGYRVECAGSIAAAEEQILVKRPGLIMLDLTLPDGDGLEFVERMRSWEPSKTSPVVVITGRQRYREALSNPLVIEWVTKPWTEEQLRSALTHAFGPRVATA